MREDSHKSRAFVIHRTNRSVDILPSGLCDASDVSSICETFSEMNVIVEDVPARAETGRTYKGAEQLGATILSLLNGARMSAARGLLGELFHICQARVQRGLLCAFQIRSYKTIFVAWHCLTRYCQPLTEASTVAQADHPVAGKIKKYGHFACA